MPNHFLWRVLDIPLIVAFVCLFAAFGFMLLTQSVKSSTAKQNGSVCRVARLTLFATVHLKGISTEGNFNLGIGAGFGGGNGGSYAVNV